MSIKIVFTILFVVLLLFFPSRSIAQGSSSTPLREETIEAVVTKVTNEKIIEPDGKEQLHQTLQLTVTKGSIKGKKITIENGDLNQVNVMEFDVDDKVIAIYTKNYEGKDVFYVQDYIRRDWLYLLFFIFIGIVIMVGTRRGIAALAGMVFSFFVIFAFILPQITSGRDPILIAILASIAIVPVTFYLSHGFNRKTSTAIAGTFIALIITGVLATIFVSVTRLTGFSSEEAGFLQAQKGGIVNIKGLLLAGIIVSVLGILDDITVSQAAVVHQLKKLSPNLTFMQLFSKAMDVGRDHIASVVNTLVLVYAGAALPLFLLFTSSSRPFGQVINHEVIAEEIIRTLVASIGLILAVPITTFLTAYFIKKK